jgi:hypothetical protein
MPLTGEELMVFVREARPRDGEAHVASIALVGGFALAFPGALPFLVIMRRVSALRRESAHAKALINKLLGWHPP